MKIILSTLIIFFLSFTFTYAETITPVQNFGTNPGENKMFIYVPDNVSQNAPLVVSLHGCLQDAETYSNAGWKELADKWKFYLIFPEQNTNNNAYQCWNWFKSEDNRRGYGESKSIIEMIDNMKANYSIDGSRVYIEGLSSGGWMTTVILASYPDVFAGGATNAGGPAFCASVKNYFWDPFGWWTVYISGLQLKKCLDRHDKSPVEWGNLIRNMGYTKYSGSWPIISIWHGSADRFVNISNQQELVEQWSNIHDIDLIPDRVENKGPNTNIIHKEYQNSKGKVLIETYLVAGMKHGTPISMDFEHNCGKESEYILNERICGVHNIGLFWGLNK